MSSVESAASAPVAADAPAPPPVRLAASAATVLVQPTTLCNLDCAYCYLPDRAVARRMPLAVADAVAAGVREWARTHPVRVLWHGGEPLAVGLPYFRLLLERFAVHGDAHEESEGEAEGRGGSAGGGPERHGGRPAQDVPPAVPEGPPAAPDGPYPVEHGVQTNATLIDEAWCELFASWPVAVDISIDGPGAANAARVDRGGRESTAKALRGAELLRSAGIPFGLIAVVNDPCPRAARELYAFAVDLGCRSLGVNLAERKGVHTLPGPRAGDPVVAFWAELAACRGADPRVRVREFEQAYSYVRAELAGHAVRRAARPLPPLPMVCHDGTVVPISPELAGFTHPAYGSFATGNVLDTPLTRLVAEAPDVPWVAEALDGVRACRDTCEYFAYCRGGQAANKYFETGRMDTTETVHCRTTKIDLMEGILAHAQQQHRH